MSAGKPIGAMAPQTVTDEARVRCVREPLLYELTVNEAQCALLRELLLEEQHRAAEILANQAADAAERGAASDNMHGDDARSTFHGRVRVTAELLDKFGWSMRAEEA